MSRRRLLVLVVIAALLASAVALRAAQLLSPARPGAPEVIFVVERGRGLGAVARKLEREGLVRDARSVKWLARFRGLEAGLQAGEYRLSAGLSPGEILERIAAGRVATYEVSFPEGFTAAQIGERLSEEGLASAEAFARVVRDPRVAEQLGVAGPTLEGYLYPETYRFPRGLEPLVIARGMVEQFRDVWREIEPLAQAHELGMREVVTLASIVEKETGAPEERPLIASVFRNRLARKMRLESDPTVIYGIPDFDGNLRRRDLENGDNPYNTYRIRGLPPGPIASPGRASLLAVVEPADSDYLFFVSRNDGTHFFSSTYREHVNAVNRYQRRRSR